MYRTLRCDPKLFDKDLSGATYLVTGANSGVGLETTRQLVRQGAHVVMGCRRVEAGEEAAAGMSELRGSTEVLRLDLADLSSVREAAAAFLERHDRLDGLINNAGIMATPEGKTADGFELQFGTNHLGHFLLTELLLEVLKASAPSRIVCLASSAHEPRDRDVTIHFEDLGWEQREYDPTLAYAQSKLANVLHAKALARRLEGTGVTAYSVHPGWVNSNLFASSGASWLFKQLVLRPLGPLITMISNEDGAQTTLHCLLDDDAPAHSGAFFAQATIVFKDRSLRAGGWPMRSPNPAAHDESIASRLYDVSLALVGEAGA